MRRTDSMLGGENFDGMTAADFMETDIFYYAEDSRIDRLATAMTLGNFGSIPIVDRNKRLVGIVSEFDLLNVIKKRKELREVTAGEVMTRALIFVHPETHADKIVELLQREHLIRVPVVDQNKKLIGIVARRDILRGYLKSKETLPPWWF
ncbi:MAG TPA: CBS domain-containing protein [Nitrospiria bacterium]|nr:CBS domain-containing protein [Nitrospiria bacterium]